MFGSQLELLSSLNSLLSLPHFINLHLLSSHSQLLAHLPSVLPPNQSQMAVKSIWELLAEHGLYKVSEDLKPLITYYTVHKLPGKSPHGWFPLPPFSFPPTPLPLSRSILA